MTSTFMTTQDKAVRQQAVVSDQPMAIARGIEGVLWLTTTNVMTRPRYATGQTVCFVGGVGIIKSCRPESGTWTYAVQMELGPEPEMGRVGSETTILLLEADMHEVIN